MIVNIKKMLSKLKLLEKHEYHWSCHNDVIDEYKNNVMFRHICQIRLIDELDFKNIYIDKNIVTLHNKYKTTCQEKMKFSHYLFIYHFDLLDDWSWKEINNMNYKYEYKYDHYISYPVFYNNPSILS